MQLNNIQELAIKLALENKDIFSITGSAGTGKSTVIKEVYDGLVAKGLNVSVLAPTGRAASLLSSKIQAHCQTIHKFLCYSTYDFGKTYQPQLGERNKSISDYIIVDEASMINREVFDNLLKALKDECKLLLVGDPNQLPPIEKVAQTSPFKLCIANFKSIQLSIRYRFGKQQDLSMLSDRILEGKLSEVMANPMTYRLDGVTDEHLINKLCNTAKYYDYCSQIISPVYKSSLGCDWINRVCQSIRFPNKSPIHINSKGHHLLEQDKVITTINTDAFSNGDIFYLEGISDTEIGLICEGGTAFKYPRFKEVSKVMTLDLANYIEPAYSITTHKSQGGEYDNVVYIIGKASIPVICRSNIYTGVTRSAQNLVFLYDKYTLQKGLANVPT